MKVTLPMVPNITSPLGQSAEVASAGVSSLFRSSLERVDRELKSSSELKQRFEEGDPGVSLTEVMIQSQKAGIALETAIQVRNKGIEAYNKIANMPV